MGRRVDAYATERQYLDHLVPIWWALRPEERGRFYLAGSLADQADTHGIGADAWIGHCPSGDRVTMVASYRDEVNCPRPVVYVEHGAGQRYRQPDGTPIADPAYHGSAGHDRVVLFICHREGTLILDPSLPDLGWLAVEDHPSAKERRTCEGLEVVVHGLPLSFAEVVTPEHRYWARRVSCRQGSPGRRYWIGTPHWIEAQHLDWDTWIGYPIDMTTDGAFPPLSCWDPHIRRFVDLVFPLFDEPDFWWLVGLWWGDGTLGGQRNAVLTWCMSDAHPEVRAHLIEILDRFGYRWVEERPKTGAKMSTVRICNSVLTRWLSTWRRGNSRKTPPAWVERLPSAHQQQLLRGYFAADGYCANGEMMLSSIHLPGLLSVRRMLARQGDVASITKRSADGVRHRMPHGGVSWCSAQYNLRINDSSFLGNPPRDRTPTVKQAFIADGCLWSRVKTVNLIPPTLFVPIQTATGSYLTAFGQSHNCPREEVCVAWRERYPSTLAVAVGCPKLDYRLRVGPRIRNPESRRTVCVSFHSDLRVCAETTSALRHYEPGLAAVVAEVRAAGCDFIGHGHPRDWQRIRAVWDRLGVEAVSDFHEVLGRADVFAVDTSSTLYEAAACGIRVVAMNAPWYRRDVHHGLRWWSDIPGPQVDGPGELAAALLAEETQEEADHRRAVVGHVYAHLDGHSAERAADAIQAIVH